MSARLLDGVRVLDLTNVLAGPFATLHLALLGAEVIKIENPKGGDLARKLGIVPELNDQNMGTSFLAQNANKKSVTLNTKSAEGKQIFLDLVKNADVLVENFRPDVMARLGLGWDVLKAVNPRLVYCAISGFGQTGPDAFKPAYDQIIQGLSGEMSVNGDERLSPLRTGFPVCDTVGGLNAAFALMAALFHRERTGQGQCIEGRGREAVDVEPLEEGRRNLVAQRGLWRRHVRHLEYAVTSSIARRNCEDHRQSERLQGDGERDQKRLGQRSPVLDQGRRDQARRRQDEWRDREPAHRRLLGGQREGESESRKREFEQLLTAHRDASP